MTKERACANTPVMSRRAFATALPALGATLATPVSPDTGQTEILRLFHLHQAIKESSRTFVSGETGTCEADQMDFLFYRHIERLEAEMMVQPSTCAADLAAKMIIAHCDGELTCLSWDDPLWMEARQLTGSA